MLQHPYRSVAASLAAVLVAFSLAACAPEPGSAPDGSEFHGKNPIEQGEAEHPEPPEEAFEKRTEIPESFPAAFPLIDGLTVDDTGEREPGVWFIVFEARDQAGADAAWQAVIEQGGFTVGETADTTEGGIAATLTSAELSVIAVTMPEPDGGPVFLNYDITSIAG
ncbi:hypothetical protein [Leucobacter sp. gxy201]|uniref:hypothetical protein n=1 Tax=Leucobacter sp. gxy201 TaxID=2957200 RepID=UPI003DA12BF0